MEVNGEDIIRFMVPMRKSVRKQLASRAIEANMTMRAFVMFALKAQGIDVRDDEIVDQRTPWRDERAAAPEQADVA